MDTSVLVIGAGPAGALAAKVLAERGVDVLLVDKHDFPRDKTCGDALLPDALAVLRATSLDRAVLPRAKRLERIRIYAPNRTHVDLKGESAVLSRTVLDDILVKAAIASGARFMPRCSLAAPLYSGSRINGAVLRDERANTWCDVRANVTLLATGAATVPLRLFGVATRELPSATAARVYLTVDPVTANEFDSLCISYDKRICPGYGWIFPGPDRTFNVGVGYFSDARTRPRTTNLRQLLKEFSRSFPPAARLFRSAVHVTPLKGAPLRTGLTGSALSKPGLLVVGEAAGLTYSFSGEGIGKAMDSGVRAARLIAEGFGHPTLDLERLADRYAREIASAFADTFRAYKRAQDWLERPSIANLVTWRANAGTYARTQLEAFVAETGRPDALFSFSGIAKALLA